MSSIFVAARRSTIQRDHERPRSPRLAGLQRRGGWSLDADFDPVRPPSEGPQHDQHCGARIRLPRQPGAAYTASIQGDHIYDYFQAQTHLYDERKVRRSSSSSLEIIPYDYRADGDANKPAVAPVGSMVVYAARKGSAKLKAIRSAARKNSPMPSEILAELEAEYSPRKPVSLEESVQVMQAADVLLDVTYGDHLVLSNFALVPGLSLVAVPLIYSGGKFDEKSFQVVQYVKKGSKANLDVVAVVNTPVLNPAEAAALRKIPATMRHLHVTGGVPDVS